MELFINDIKYSRPLFIFALKAEAGREFKDCNIIFTGIGKVNATYQLTKAIQKYQPDFVINLGTAGGFGLKRGEVVCAMNLCKEIWTSRH